MLYVLTQSAVLPRDLKKYTTHGWPKDKSVMTKILGPTYSLQILEGEVLATSIRNGMEWLLSTDTSVALLLFSGHGVHEGSSHHGSMVCSFNQRVSAADIDETAYKQKFQGTFIRVLNMCEASSEPTEYNRSPALSGEALRAEQKNLGSSQQAYDGVTIAATSKFETTDGNSKGSKFMVGFKSVFHNQVVTYDSLYQALQTHPDCRSATVRQTAPLFTGVFGTPAKKVNMSSHAVAAEPNEHSWESTDSDVEF